MVEMRIIDHSPLRRAHQALLSALIVLASALCHTQPISPPPTPSLTAGESSALPLPVPISRGGASNLDNPDFVRAIIVDVTGPALKSADGIRKLVADARNAGFNTIIAQVRQFGDAYYASKIVPLAASLPPGFDPLKTLLDESRAGGKPLKFYAMMVMPRVWSKRQGAVPEASIAAKHPEWITESVDGSKDSGDDATEVWLDPGVIAVQDYMALVAAEVAANYPIDAVLLDRMRYPDVSLKFGYNPAAVQRYNLERKKSGKPDPNDPDWVDWRRAQVTQCVQKIAGQVRKARPLMAVAVTGVTYGAPPADRAAFAASSDVCAKALSDYIGWCETGLADINVLADFKRADRGGADFRGWMKFAAENRGKSRLIVGIGGYLNPPKSSAVMMLTPIFHPQVAGLAVSSYDDPSDSRDTAGAAFSLFRKVFDPAIVEARSKEAPTSAGLEPWDDPGRLEMIAANIVEDSSTATTPAKPPLEAMAPSTAPPELPSFQAQPARSTPLPPPAPTAASVPSALLPMPRGPGGALAPPFNGAGGLSLPVMPGAGSVTVPGMQGQTNYRGEAITGPSPVSATITPPSVFTPRPPGTAGAGRASAAPPGDVTAMTQPDLRPPGTTPAAPPIDGALRGSMPAARIPVSSVRNYSVPAARPTALATTPAPGTFNTIILRSGKEFPGKVVERGRTWKIQLPNGSIITVPYSKIAREQPGSPAESLTKDQPQ